jgi:solute:Na+ symporter, SSS family
LDISLADLVGIKITHPEWMPTIGFTWRIMFGTIVTVAVALCFKTDDATQRGHELPSEKSA